MWWGVFSLKCVLMEFAIPYINIIKYLDSKGNFIKERRIKKDLILCLNIQCSQLILPGDRLKWLNCHSPRSFDLTHAR